MATEEIEISQLELAEDLAPDMVLPVETTADTKATTLQKIKEWLNGFFVDKTSNQEIGGEKVFNGKLKFKTGASYMIEEIINSYTRGSIPSSQIVTGIELFDKNKNKTGRFYQVFGTDGNMSSRMICFNSDGSKNAWLGAGFDSSGKIYTYAPECDSANSIVTTMALSKAENGYVKFGNGLIICWGSVGGGSSVTATFPTAFTTTPRVASATTQGSGGGYERVIVSITKTGFTSKGYGGASAYTSHYIAIGY